MHDVLCRTNSRAGSIPTPKSLQQSDIWQTKATGEGVENNQEDQEKYAVLSLSISKGLSQKKMQLVVGFVV